MLRKMRILLLVTLGVLFLSSPAMAAYEYYTYDGFEPIVRAFTAISHIFKNNQMILLAGVASVIGMTVAGVSFLVTSVSGAKGSVEMVFFPAIVGMALYLAMFTHTETLIVYDSHTNQFQSIPEVPVGIVYIASAINDIEVGMVNIIETAFGGFGSVQQAAGAYNILTASKFFEGGAFSAYVTTSLQAYTNDCVLFEMTVNPSGGLNPESLRKSSDFLPLFGQAVNPAIFTTYFDAATPNGQNLSCTDAWAQLNPVLTQATTYTATISKACGGMGFGDDPFQLAKCRSLAEGFLQSPSGANVASASLESVARQALIAKTIFEVIRDGSSLESMTMQANRTMTSKGIGTIVASNEWLPYFKAGMTAVSLGLIPIVAVFMATPLAGRSLSFIFGIFIFLAAWGVADAVATASGSIYTYKLFAAIRDTGLGLDTFINFPDYTTKMASVFGTLRSMAVAFAGLISMMMVKFGGHFLAGIGSNIMGQVQGTGGEAGRMGLPEGRTSAMSSMISSAGTESWANNNSFGTMAGADAYGRQWNTEGYKAGMTKASALGMEPQQYMHDSQMGFNVAKPGGAYSGTVAPDGSGMVNSDLNSKFTQSLAGTKGAPATQVTPTSLGLYGSEITGQTHAAASKQLGNQVARREKAGEDLSAATRGVKSNFTGMQASVTAGAERGDSQATGLKTLFDTAAQNQQSLTDGLVERHGLNQEDARLLGSELSAGMQAGLSFKAGGGLATFLTENLLGAKGTASVGGQYNTQVADRKKLAETIQSLRSEDYKQAQTLSNSERVAMDKASGSNYVEKQGNGKQYSDGYRASLEESKGAGANYGKEWSSENSMRENLETGRKTGAMSKENLNPALEEHLNQNVPGGKNEVQNLLAQASSAGPERQAAMETLRPHVANFAEAQAEKILGGQIGQAVTAGGAAISTEVGDAQARVKDQITADGTPAQAHGQNTAEVQQRATAAGVAPGATPKPVETGLGAPTEENYYAKAAEVKGNLPEVAVGKARLEEGGGILQDQHDHAKDTSKAVALTQVAGGELHGAADSIGSGAKSVATFTLDNMLGRKGSERMEGLDIKGGMSNPDSPMSPAHHFGPRKSEEKKEERGGDKDKK